MYRDPLPGVGKSCFCEKITMPPAIAEDGAHKTYGGPTDRKVASIYNTNPVDLVHDKTKSCTLKADIIVVLDESGSVGEDNFWTVKHGVEKLYKDFNASGSGEDLRMGLVKFSSDALVETELTSDFNTLVKDVEKTPYGQGATFTREAYNEAKKLLDNGSKGADYRKIIVFITDGVTSKGVKPDKTFSDTFHDDKIEIITVGIKGYSKEELLIMSRLEDYIITLTEFDQMSGITDKIF
jgi:Mg-chelatase subunit ChlD